MTICTNLMYFLIIWLWGVPIYIQVAAAPPLVYIWARPENDRKDALKNAPNGRSLLNRLAIRPFGARAFQLLFRILAIVSGQTSPIYKPSSQHLKSSNKMYLSQ